ncbi:Na+/H+ antiporter subunit E [Synechococcus sp. CS-1328]|nr:Na+/H+ antiporter subunit E [Synechococcus sp. CS-1328]
MPLLLSTSFRLLLWCLLTADLSRLNLLIGVAVALALPRARSRPLPLRELLRALWLSLVAVPRAYGEALRLMVASDLEERMVREPVTDRTIPLLMFLDVFRITLTPFTIALGLEPDGQHYRVHALLPRRQTLRPPAEETP